jgi:hypothetical protein
MLPYRDYVATRTALEADNVLSSAYLEVRFAEFASAFIAFLIQLLKNIGKAFEALEAELKELKTLLEKARKEVKEADAQRVIGTDAQPGPYPAEVDPSNGQQGWQRGGGASRVPAVTA